jgi:hypothetical protein
MFEIAGHHLSQFLEQNHSDVFAGRVEDLSGEKLDRWQGIWGLADYRYRRDSGSYVFRIVDRRLFRDSGIEHFGSVL